jgi:hypothetical protein
LLVATLITRTAVTSRAADDLAIQTLSTFPALAVFGFPVKPRPNRARRCIALIYAEKPGCELVAEAAQAPRERPRR